MLDFHRVTAPPGEFRATPAASPRDELGEVTLSTALPLSMQIAPSSHRPARSVTSVPRASISSTGPRLTPLPRFVPPTPPPIPRTTVERMLLGRERIRRAAESGQRIRAYEVALDLDFSEFHFARQFRAAFGSSPHGYYDEVRADRARALLREGLSDGEVARRVGFRRPAELRALLSKTASPEPQCEGDTNDG